MPNADLFVGLDLGTSGARAVVIDAEGTEIAHGAVGMVGNHRSPQVWWQAAEAALEVALAQVDRARIKAIAVDGTSGTVLAVDAQGAPLAEALMYNDPCADGAILTRIAAVAPHDSAARGATSGLARALLLQPLQPCKLLHQADWIACRFSGVMVSDANNTLKTGYDALAGCWPDWIAEAGLEMGLLPDTVAAGTAIGPITAKAMARFGLPAAVQIVAGTTDGCASFLATGAAMPGDGVTVLGTTLTLKILSDRPIAAPEYGIYSHRILGMWLAGGASNTGGAALLAHFTTADLGRLSSGIDPETDSGLDYYPLPRPGERFPVADPQLAPRLTPRPANDALFLQGMFEGIAGIEAAGYRRLTTLGAPDLATLRTVGGGAGNPVWTRLRERKLGVPMPAPRSDAAAYGAALLAQRGVT